VGFCKNSYSATIEHNTANSSPLVFWFGMNWGLNSCEALTARVTNIMNYRKFLLSATSFAPIGTFLSCISVKPGYIADDKAATAKAIEQFHVRLSKGQIDEIYRDADESFHLSQTREVLITAIQATRARFGGFKTTPSSELNVIVGAPVRIRAAYILFTRKVLPQSCLYS